MAVRDSMQPSTGWFSNDRPSAANRHIGGEGAEHLFLTNLGRMELRNCERPGPTVLCGSDASY